MSRTPQGSRRFGGVTPLFSPDPGETPYRLLQPPDISALIPSASLRSTSAADPPPRPTSPRTRFAPTLRHSATWASPQPSDRSWRRAPASAPMPSLVRRPSTPCLAETSPRLHTHTARRLRRHRPPRAVRLATLAVGAAAHVRVASAGFARHRLPLPAVPRVRDTEDGSARASGVALRASAVGAVSNSCTPHFTLSGSGAADDDADRRRANLVRASVFNTLSRANVPTTPRLVASGDIAPLTPSASLRSPSAPFTSASLALASHRHRCRRPLSCSRRRRPPRQCPERFW